LYGDLHKPTSETHVCVLQTLVSFSLAQGFPPFVAGALTVRVLLCTPFPQISLQGPNGSHSFTTQSVGQGEVLHLRESFSIGHRFPPCAGDLNTVRNLDCVPPEHPVLHTLHDFQMLTSQLTMQGFVAHARTSVSAGHPVGTISGTVTSAMLSGDFKTLRTLD
jgi:hypothetical protein